MQMAIRAAQQHLSTLVDAALSGEEVVITRRGKPVVKLVAIHQRTFKFGLVKDQLKDSGPDFLDAMEEPDLAAWEGSGTKL